VPLSLGAGEPLHGLACGIFSQFRFVSADQVVRTLDIAAATWVAMFLAGSGENLSDRAGPPSSGQYLDHDLLRRGGTVATPAARRAAMESAC
jgi:hypothetical protein